jgi:hypothetical protein
VALYSITQYSKQHENAAWKKNTLINVISHAGQAGESSRRIDCPVFLFTGDLGQILTLASKQFNSKKLSIGI